MSQFLDFVPILVFVIVFFVSDIYAATAALMIAVSLQLVIFWAIKKPIGRQLQLVFWASMIFGGLTLVFRNELFIQWKPTIVNLLMAVALAGSHYFGESNLTKKAIGKQISLPDEEWSRINFGWACGFSFAAALNLVVAYNFSMEFWVSYKLIGGFALIFLYVAIMVIYLSKKGYLENEKQGPAVEEPKIEKEA
ncbi:MAG: septation protein IspZ [Gammaproteobacteria bacterium]|nr:septation protein IspZ [Gammaproteobacteria bacterium]MCZ6853871.1 septation protein IspZ [Gammaproteobacteria bacterium]